jgi:2-oxoisovalerate dehydrogenase E1 component beta subunit
MPELTMVQALNAALRRGLADDERALVFGEDVGRLGGVFRVTDGLQREFGERRVFDTPLAEAGIVGIAVGWPWRAGGRSLRYSSTASATQP